VVRVLERLLAAGHGDDGDELVAGFRRASRRWRRLRVAVPRILGRGHERRHVGRSLPFPVSVEKVTEAVPSSGLVGAVRSNSLVVTEALIAPASVAKLTVVGMPTRLPNRSVRRTLQVIVRVRETVAYTGRLACSQWKLRPEAEAGRADRDDGRAGSAGSATVAVMALTPTSAFAV